MNSFTWLWKLSEGKYGAAAALGPNGGLEISWMVYPEIDASDMGLTVVDCDVALIVGESSDYEATSGLFLKFPDEELEFKNKFLWNPTGNLDPVLFEGNAVQLLGYARWVDRIENPFSYTIQSGRRAKLAFLGINSGGTQIWDNVRVFNVLTTMPQKNIDKR